MTILRSITASTCRRLLRNAGIPAIALGVTIAAAGCVDTVEQPTGISPIPTGDSTAAAAPLNQGDTATFSYYDRDTSNIRIETSRRVKVWAVLRAGLTMFDSTDVQEIEETTYDAAGATLLERDTIYMRTAADGSLYQYDALRPMLRRIPLGDALDARSAPVWVRISAPATETAGWSSIGADSIAAENVAAPGIPATMNIIFKMIASPKGTQPVTVTAGSYPASVHIDHNLRLNIRLYGPLPLPVLNDSILATYDVSATDGILRHTFQSRVFITLVGNQCMPVTGYEMELMGIRRKK